MRWQFLEGCIEQQPDLLLAELQERLHGTIGTRVSKVTISRSLNQRGLSRTQVSY